MKSVALLEFIAFGTICGTLPGALLGLMIAIKAHSFGSAFAHILGGFSMGVLIGALNGLMIGIISLLIRRFRYSPAQYRVLVLINVMIVTGVLTWVICRLLHGMYVIQTLTDCTIYTGVGIAASAVAGQAIATQYLWLEYGKKKKRTLEADT